MTPRERLRAACTGSAVDCAPVVIPYHAIFLRDHWEEVTTEPWWKTSDGNIASSVQVERDFLESTGMDWTGVGIGASRQFRETHAASVRDGVPYLTDTVTGEETELRHWPRSGDHYSVNCPSVTNLEDIERVVQVRAAREILDAGFLDGARAVVESVGASHAVYAAVNHPSWTYTCFGFENMMTNMVENPALVHALSERMCEKAIEEIKAFAAIGVDFVWVELCLVGRDSISLSAFREFGTPYSRPLVDVARENGMITVFYVCGDVSDRLEDLVSVSPMCLSFEESKKGFCVDLDTISRVVGDSVCLFGNLDAVDVLENGSDALLAREIERLLEIGNRTGRFVMSLGSPVTPDTPVARVRRFGELTRPFSSR